MPPKTPEERMRAIESRLRQKVSIGGAPPMNLTERMAHYNIPNISMAVIREGAVESAKTTTLPSKKAITTETLIQAGSISKPVAAVLALKLVEQGLLQLDTDINKVLTSWKLPESEYTRTEKVTLRRLLSHTAGLTVHGFLGYESSTPSLPTLVQLLRGDLPANSEKVQSNNIPGLECVYSGGGTEIVQLLIEDAVEKQDKLEGKTPRKFHELAKELIFEPLGMKHSTYQVIHPSDVSQNINFAQGHTSEGESIAGEWRLHPESSAAGLWTTSSDLGLFILGIQNHQLLSESMTNEMLTRQLNSEFGLGFEVDEDDLKFSHTGVNIGFQSQLVAFSDQAVVIMINSDNGLALINEIIPAIAEVYEWPEQYQVKPDIKEVITLDPTLLESYCGDFQATIDYQKKRVQIKFSLSIEEGELILTAPTPEPTSAPQQFKLQAESETTFFSLPHQFNLVLSQKGLKMDVFGCEALKTAPSLAITQEAQALLKGQLKGLKPTSKSAEEPEKHTTSPSKAP